MLQRVEVRAVRRRVPSLESGLSERTTRRETPSYELINPFSQGQTGALLNVSPDFVATANGQYSFLGGPASSNQLTLGGIQMPAGMVIGAKQARVATSPWDVSAGGAAGATVAIEQNAGSQYGSTYAIVRTGAAGATGGQSAPDGINLPLQAKLTTSGKWRRLGYSSDFFVARTATNLPRWDEALRPATLQILDSLGALVGTPVTQGAELNLQYGMIARLDLLPSEPESGPPREPKRAEYVTLALTRSAQDGGLRGRFATASAASRSDLAVGVLQFDSRRIVGGR